jgi:hypothetical protein
MLSNMLAADEGPGYESRARLPDVFEFQQAIVRVIYTACHY